MPANRLFQVFCLTTLFVGLIGAGETALLYAQMGNGYGGQNNGNYGNYGNYGNGHYGNGNYGNHDRHQSNYRPDYRHDHHGHGNYKNSGRYGYGFPPYASNFNYGFYQRPYPYHLDYYRMRYQGSYAPYFGNLYGPPLIQQFVTPSYLGPQVVAPQFSPSPFFQGPIRNYAGAYYW